MRFQFDIPTKIIFEENGLKKNANLISNCGKRAMIITGKTSGEKSGALKDVLAVLGQQRIPFHIFDQVENNPSLSNIEEGKMYGKAFQPDFLIAIGGGSPLDAAKAISALQCNRKMTAKDLVTHTHHIKEMLPIVAIPTTAGTGSEVTPYSILTIPEMETKKSFAHPKAFPKIAFLDWRYTETLPNQVTIDTAFDAFSHLLESYLSIKSNDMVGMMALEGMNHFSKTKNSITDQNFDQKAREHLLYASLLGGMCIAHTGTTIIHALGYSLTYFKGLSHGHANTLFFREYLKFNIEKETQKIQNILRATGFDSIDAMGDFFEANVAPMELSRDEIKKYTQLALVQKSIQNNPQKAEEKQLMEIYEKVLLKKT